MKLLDRLAQVAWRRRLAEATIDAYTSWVRSYLAHCADQHGSWVPPEHLHTVDVEAFLNYLVLEKRLSASSQNQALNALVFLYRHVSWSAFGGSGFGVRGARGPMLRISLESICATRCEQFHAVRTSSRVTKFKRTHNSSCVWSSATDPAAIRKWRW